MGGLGEQSRRMYDFTAYLRCGHTVKVLTRGVSFAWCYDCGKMVGVDDFATHVTVKLRPANPPY